MLATKASVVALLGLAAALGALVAASLIDRPDPVQVEDDPREAALRESAGEYEVDSLPLEFQGPVDTAHGREVAAHVHAYVEGLDGRAGVPRITPNRAAFEVPIVGLSEEEAAEVGQLATDEIAVTATVATLSESELEAIASRLVEHVEGTDTYVRLDTVNEQVTLVSPEPLSEHGRSQARSRVDEVLGELMAARRLAGDEAPHSSSDVTPDDILAFEAGLRAVQAPAP